MAKKTKPPQRFINVYLDGRLIDQRFVLEGESYEAAVERVKQAILVVPRAEDCSLGKKA